MGATRFAQPSVRREVGFTKMNGRALTYSRVPKDKDGWADATTHVPRKGDLVELQMADRKVIGWWAGAYWFGHRVLDSDHVSHWKPVNIDY
jgi:hypothetical protein